MVYMKAKDPLHKAVLTDLHTKCAIIRSIEELEQYSASIGGVQSPSNKGASNAEERLIVKPITVTKKKINIPIGLVTVDEDYENIVAASYTQSKSYIRYTKKIGDEKDVSIDYVIEDDDINWLETNPSFKNDKEIPKHLTQANLETIINLLEKQTAFSRELIPLNLAERHVSEIFSWPASITTKVTSCVYHYWTQKRNKWYKPVCRRYWPQTANTDTNPHHVFRPRDKERYKLRRQARKNDLESFRKMQQLRKEFGRARNLLQLVLERESLKEAELECQKEIFLQAIYDLTTTTNEPRLPTVFKHKLLFPHLLNGDAIVDDDNYGGDVKLKFTLNRRGNDSSGNLKAQDNDVIKEKKKKSGSSQVQGNAVKRKRPNEAMLDDGYESDDYDIAADMVSPGILFPGLAGPPYLCRPMWPSFMAPLYIRNKAPVLKALTEYISELEIPFESMYDSSYGAIAGNNGSEYQDNDAQVPVGFTCRGRMGRGGRILIDRFPIYDDSNDNFERGSKCVRYINPTSLPPRNNSISAQIELQQINGISTSPLKLSNITVPMIPPVRSAYSAQLHTRELEIYAHSDSEDELLEIGSNKIVQDNASSFKYISKL